MYTIFIACPLYVVPYLKQELETLGYQTEDENFTGVFIKGTYNDIVKLNYSLRTANRVLLMVDTFFSRDQKDLFNKLKKINWIDYFSADKYISFTSQTNHPSINNSMFLNQLCKDAVVDYFTSNFKKRPNSGPLKSEVVLHVHWHDNKAWVYLDTSGEQLHKHNYRLNPFMAPVQENLVSALIMATGWNCKSSFVNPMCGSGTFAIEAALMASNRMPALLRDNFSFMHYNMYDEIFAKDFVAQLSKQIIENNLPQIIATDIESSAIRAAQENAERAGVEHLIQFRRCDFSETTVPEGDGVVLLNPPYGERLGEEENLILLYKAMGDFLKRTCTGKTAFIFTGQSNLAKKIGLKASRRMEFYNGPIECRLLRFEMYSGSRDK